MKNDWLKEKVREELEVEYIQKLEDFKNFYEKKLLDCCEEAYELLQNEREKNKTLEVRLYEEYEKKVTEFKKYIMWKTELEEIEKFDKLRWDMVELVDKFLMSPMHKGMPAAQIVDTAIQGLKS